jgi:sigma-E factor negative regulatory protein RseA
MSDEIREQLSALVDDELSDVEQPLLLGRLQRDAELRACLGRYQLIGEVMRGSGDTATLGIADRVQQALAGDIPATAEASGRMPLWKPVAGLAVAASVALVAILTVSPVGENPSGNVPLLVTADPAPVVEQLAVSNPAITTVSNTGDDTQWDRLDQGIDKRLSGYLVNHNEYAASRGVQGVMPYVRIVSHDTGE